MAEHQVPRKMVLTELDIEAIASILQERHVCRYDIDPEKMGKMIAFVESFYDGAIETRRAVRSMLIRVVVWGAVAGILTLLGEKFGLFRFLLKALKSGG